MDPHRIILTLAATAACSLALAIAAVQILL